MLPGPMRKGIVKGECLSWDKCLVTMGSTYRKKLNLDPAFLLKR